MTRIPRPAKVIGVVFAVLLAAVLAAAAQRSLSDDQCSRPLSERVGGWACFEGDQPEPASTQSR